MQPMTESPPVQSMLNRVLHTQVNIASLLLLLLPVPVGCAVVVRTAMVDSWLTLFLILFAVPAVALAHVIVYTFLPTRAELQRSKPDQRWKCLKRLIAALVFDGSILYVTYLVLPIASANTPAW
jgi:hypothetical protein